MPFLKSRTGADAISDMKNPPITKQSISLNPGILVADKWASVLDALALQGYQNSSSSSSSSST